MQKEMTVADAEAALWKAMKGCSKCEYDEAEGGLFNHCNACCRKTTAAAWQLGLSKDFLSAEVQSPRRVLP